MLDYFLSWGISYLLKHLALYQSLFEPHLNYCNIIRSNTFPSHLGKLTILHEKIIWAMSWAKFDTPSDLLFHRYGLLKITELKSFHNACTVFCVVKKLNERLCDLIPVSFPLHSYQTRKRHFIKRKNKTKQKLKCTSLSVVCKGPQVWNNLDRDLQMSPSIRVFKNRLKK